MRRLLLASAIICGLPCQGVFAESAATLPAAAPTGLDTALWQRMKQIDAKAATIADLSADFEQTKYTPLLKKPMVSTGTVLARGDIMRWDTRVPEPTVMRVDETRIELYYPNQRIVEFYPLAGRLGALASSPVPRLANLLDHFSFALASAQEAGMKDGPDRLALRMTPIDNEMRQQVDHVNVLIDSAHGFILALSLVDPDGERSEIRFSNIRTNTNLDRSRLELKLPEGIKTVRPLEGIESPPPSSSKPAR